MARKLKTYVTSLGFFDLAIAAPSMKAALGACGWISISSTRDSKGKQRFSHRRRDHVETRRHSQAPGRIRRTFQGARRASHAPGGRQAQAQTDDRAYGGDGIDTPILNSGQGLRVNLNTGFIDANPANSGYGPYFQGVQAEYGLGPGPGYTPHAQGDPQDVTGVENVLGSKYDDALYGNALANNLAGGDGNDLLSGLDGNDVIGGGNGNDIIFGGIGTDTLTGGKDSDTFIWTT